MNKITQYVSSIFHNMKITFFEKPITLNFILRLYDSFHWIIKLIVF